MGALTTFYYTMVAADGEDINPHPLDVEAKDLGHAMQKIAASLSDHCAEVKVWMGYSQTARLKLVEKFK